MIQYVDLLSDTICSLITAPGYAGVSVIRVSGDKAVEYTKNLAPNLPENLETHRSYLSKLVNKQGELVDESLVTFFKKDKSFTGDETVEVACHGNPLLVNQITDLYLSQGARSAERGEFSFRAFYNGKLDLVQAESIHNVVTNSTRLASGTSLKHLTGELSNQFKEIEEDIVLGLSHLEATIDFVEQDIDPQDYQAVTNRLNLVLDKTQNLIETYDVGKNLNGGHKVLLLGATNVGKSSLFNRLFNEERAIVTDVAGTTRDLVRGQTFLGNAQIEFIDSAGIRNSDDTIEKIGIQKSIDQKSQADLVLFVIENLEDVDRNLLKTLSVQRTLFVINKVDLPNSAERVIEIKKAIHSSVGEGALVYEISAIENRGIGDLKSAVESGLAPDQVSDEKVVITQARHFNHLTKIKNHLEESLNLLNLEESPDLISQELSLGLMEINQLLGKEYNDEILDKIFSDFCIGK